MAADLSPRSAAPALLLALSALLAGCSGDEPSDIPVTTPPSTSAGPAPPDNVTSDLPAVPITLEFQGCLQLHTFFPFPIAALTQLGFQLPDGFQFASADGQTVDAFLAWWFCPTGLLNDTQNAPFEEVGSMFASLPVVPPADLSARDPVAEPPQLDLIPLTWVVSNQLAARFLDEVPGLAGGYVDQGPVLTTTEMDGAVAVRGMTAQASFGTFDVDAVYQSAPAGNPAGRYRMWLAPEEAPVTAYLDIGNTAGSTLGSGQADLRFQGDPEAGAPPATGGLSHVVDETGVVLRVVELQP